MTRKVYKERACAFLNPRPQRGLLRHRSSRAVSSLNGRSRDHSRRHPDWPLCRFSRGENCGWEEVFCSGTVMEDLCKRSTIAVRDVSSFSIEGRANGKIEQLNETQSMPHYRCNVLQDRDAVVLVALLYPVRWQLGVEDVIIFSPSRSH